MSSSLPNYHHHHTTPLNFSTSCRCYVFFSIEKRYNNPLLHFFACPISMDPNSSITEKKKIEVVLLIPEGGAATNSSKHLDRDPAEDSIPKSPEVLSPSPNSNKPPRPTQHEALRHRRSIPRSAFTQPKSRLVEQPPLPFSNSLHRQPLSRSSSFQSHGSPNPRITAEEEGEDEEVYKTEHFSQTRKRPKLRIVRITIEWFILVSAMCIMVASLTDPRWHSFVIWGLAIWKWCVMVMVVCCGRLVTRWLITLLVFLIERNFLLRNKVLYFVYSLKNNVQFSIWLGLVLLSWFLLLDHGVDRPAYTTDAIHLVSRALASLLVGSVIWLAKTMLVKILASSFQMNRFFDRIQESLFHQYMLQMLSGPPMMEFAENVGRGKSTGQLSFRTMGKGKGEEQHGVIDVARLHRMRHDKVSAWTMDGLINVIESSGLTTISNTIDESFHDDEEEPRDREITSELEAKAVAYQIFENVAKPHCKFIDEDDLLRFLSMEEVYIVLPLFEGASETGKINKSALKNWVVKAYLDRKFLAHSLNDTKTAVKQLHNIATGLVIIVIIIVTLLLMGFASIKVLVLISSQLLLVAFMFGNTCKTVFEAIIFVFVMHPFDVGDRCVVDGVQLVVEEMNILATIFLRYDNEKIYYPNSVLATKPISNFYRSPDMGDSVQFSVDITTSVECIGSLKSRIKMYIENKANHWSPTHTLMVTDIVNVNTMNMALYVQHTMNFQNMGEKNNRRSDLILEMKKIFEELSIQYQLLPQRVILNYTGSAPLPMTIAHCI